MMLEVAEAEATAGMTEAMAALMSWAGKAYDGGPGVVDIAEGTLVLGDETGDAVHADAVTLAWGGTPVLGDETGDADAVTLAWGEQVTGEASIEPVQGDKNTDALMEPKSGDAINWADMPVQMGVLWLQCGIGNVGYSKRVQLQSMRALEHG
jgi:hypothetical protein